MKNPKSILITGGSSGIGRELCLVYSKPGTMIAFSGRNTGRLEETAELVRREGAVAYPREIDVTDTPSMKTWIEESNSIAPLDLVIANAGIGTPKGLTIDETTKFVFDTNVNGVFSTIHPAIEIMQNRNLPPGNVKGQVAIVSSIAGYMGMPNSPSYSASKAAVKTYGMGLRAKLKKEGIQVNVICPGVVHTPMTEKFYRHVPGYLDVDRAAAIIKNGLDSNRGLIAFPWIYHALVKWVSGLPEGMQDFMLAQYIRKSH